MTGANDAPEDEYVELEDDEWRNPASPNTFPSGETLQEDRREAHAEHGADRPPTEEEEELAEHHPLDETAAEHVKAAMERGARQPGEGRITDSTR